MTSVFPSVSTGHFTASPRCQYYLAANLALPEQCMSCYNLSSQKGWVSSMVSPLSHVLVAIWSLSWRDILMYAWKLIHDDIKRTQALSSCPFPYSFIFFKNVLLGSSPQGAGSNAALVKTPYVPRWLKNRNTVRIYHEVTPPNSQLFVPLETRDCHLAWNSVYLTQKSKQKSSFQGPTQSSG